MGARVRLSAEDCLREVQLPESRGQLNDILGRMTVDTLQDADEIVVRVDALQAAGHAQTWDGSNMLGLDLGPAKQSVFSTQRDRSQGPVRGDWGRSGLRGRRGTPPVRLCAPGPN